MLLSIIIPVYNTGALLVRCFDSLYNQNLSEDDFEIIIVNDGSTDHSEAVCKAYMTKHSNIIYLYQTNQGQGAARNKGLSEARGCYVMFVDSDDALTDSALPKFLALAMEHKTEICVSNMKYYDAHGNCHISEEISGENNDTLLTGEDVIESRHCLIGTTCAKLFERHFLTTHHLLFSTGMLHEDVEFMARAYAFAKRIIASTFTTYIYYWNNNSTDRSFSIESIKRSLVSDAKVAMTFKNLSIDKHLSCPLQRNFKKRCHSLVVSMLLSLIKQRKALGDDFTSDFIKRLKKDGLYPIHGSTLSFKSTVIGRLLHSPLLLVLLKWK